LFYHNQLALKLGYHLTFIHDIGYFLPIDEGMIKDDCLPPNCQPRKARANSRPIVLVRRSLRELFVPFLRAGLILDALEEVNLEYAARNFTEFPEILAFRLRRGPAVARETS
jgi:hypothetical protein